MRRRDPRRLLARRREAKARVRIVEQPKSTYDPDGSIDSRQVAVITLPRAELDRIWNPEYLERLARTYWRFLTRVSLGILRIVYGADAREVVILTRPLTLLRFDTPDYDIGPDYGTVTWRIQRGLLVAPGGRDKGFLRLSVTREPNGDGSEARATIVSEVVNFYPMIAGWGWFARIGRWIYNQTQLRVHIVVTHAFLRSLANLDLEPSKVGLLRAPAS